MPRRHVPIALLFLFATSMEAQDRPAPTLGRDDIVALARIQVAISAAHDSVNAQLAQQRNKKDDLQQQLQERMRTNVATILGAAGMSDAEYRRRSFVIMTDGRARQVFDSVVSVLTGAPLPGRVAASAANTVAVPPGPVGAHIGHVVNSFTDTPMQQGLLPTAIAEARTAAQHAALAARQPTNLQYMQTHAGHVLHAIDPTIVTTGPGLGYGVKKAAGSVAAHIELAAAAAGATPAHVTHAGHVATSARNTVARADQIVALARRVQAATAASEAATLITQIVSLTEQLMAGADANGDGRVTWEAGEGGLQHCDEHVKLMLGGGR